MALKASIKRKAAQIADETGMPVLTDGKEFFVVRQDRKSNPSNPTWKSPHYDSVNRERIKIKVLWKCDKCGSTKTQKNDVADFKCLVCGNKADWDEIEFARYKTFRPIEIPYTPKKSAVEQKREIVGINPYTQGINKRYAYKNPEVKTMHLQEARQKVLKMDVPSFDPIFQDQRKKALLDWYNVFKTTPQKVNDIRFKELKSKQYQLSEKDIKQLPLEEQEALIDISLKDRAENLIRDLQITDRTPSSLYSKPIRYKDTESGADVDENYY